MELAILLLPLLSAIAVNAIPNPQVSDDAVDSSQITTNPNSDSDSAFLSSPDTTAAKSQSCMYFCGSMNDKKWCECHYDPAKRDCTTDGCLNKDPKRETCEYCRFYLICCMIRGEKNCFEWTCTKGPGQCRNRDCRDVKCLH